MTTLVLASLLACFVDNSSPGARCKDLACRANEAVAAWTDNPGGVVRLVSEEPDHMVKAAVVEAVVHAHPDSSADLCRLLVDGMTRRRCETIMADPLVWQLDPADPEGSRVAMGETAVVLEPSPTFRPVILEPSSPPACDASVPSMSCRGWRATEAAMAGALDLSAGLCAGIADTRWAHHCLLDAAQKACSRKDDSACASAVELCSAAGEHRTLCLRDVAMAMASRAPASEKDGGDEWGAMTSRLREVERRLQPIDPIMADRFANRVLAEAMLLSYGQARRVGANPLVHLDDRAVPHVRAAIAWKKAPRTPKRTLEQRSEDVLAAEQIRDLRRVAQPMPVGRVSVQQLWAETWPGEEEISWVAYLQDARRPVSPVAEEDARLCVLEAAARTEPPQTDVLVEGLGSETTLVRWSAARLLSQVSPGHVALAHALDDGDARVRARAGG